MEAELEKWAAQEERSVSWLVSKLISRCDAKKLTQPEVAEHKNLQVIGG